MTPTRPLRLATALLLLAAAACSDAPTAAETPGPEETPTGEPPRPAGVYQLRIEGIGGEQISSSLAPAPPEGNGPSRALVPQGAGIAFEQVSVNSFTEGTRAGGGQRYVSITYRVRNGSGTPFNNLTMLMVSRSNTIAGTPVSSLRRFDGAVADPAIAARVVPTGAVALGRDVATVESTVADVLQAFTEAEVAAITPPTGVTNIFPYGYVVRSASSAATRFLPSTTDANRFDGLLTVAFRVPLQPTAAQDVFGIFFEVLAVDDTEVRVTESVEEQGAESRARVAAAAAALGATTVTVLNGSASAGYTGQRQLCALRTAGTAASPTTLVTAVGPYSRLAVYRPGESMDACAAGFRTGTAQRMGVNVSTALTVRAMDRYGNVLPATVDSVALSSPDYVLTTTPRAALASGVATFTVSFGSYATPTLVATGRRLKTTMLLPVVPISRTWTGATSTSWSATGNWSTGTAPAALDTAVIPSAPASQPTLTQPVTVGAVSVANGSTIALGTFDLVVGGSVTTGQTLGGITGTTGRVVLAGSGASVAGRLPEVRVTGTYTQTGDLLLRTPAEVDGGGGLENPGFLTEIRHY